MTTAELNPLTLITPRKDLRGLFVGHQSITCETWRAQVIQSENIQSDSGWWDMMVVHVLAVQESLPLVFTAIFQQVNTSLAKQVYSSSTKFHLSRGIQSEF